MGRVATGPNINDEEPNIWAEKWIFLSIVIAYIAQGFVSHLPAVLETTMAHEIHFCPEDREREVDSYLKYANWPYSSKLILAPIVDYFGVPFFPRIKHFRGWVITAGVLQTIILVLLSLGWHSVDPGDVCPNGRILFFYLFPLVLMSSVSDIALDALAVSSFSRKNLGWAGLAGIFGGQLGGRAGSIFMLGAKSALNLDTNHVLLVFAGLVFVANVVIWQLREGEFPRRSGSACSLLRQSYFTAFLILCNRRCIALAALMVLYSAGLSSSINSEIDKMYRGYTQQDVLITGYIEVLPVLLLVVLVTRFFGQSKNPLKKIFLALLLYLVGSLLEFSTYFFVPYVDGRRDEDALLPNQMNCIDGGCASWVFPFRFILNLVASPFLMYVEILLAANLAWVTPLKYAGTFQTLFRTLWNLGFTMFASIVNPLRTLLAKATTSEQCTGGSINYGKTFIANTTLRYCGIFNCTTAPPLDGQTGYCNNMADGYNLVSIGFFIFAVILYLLFGKWVATYLDVPTGAYHPRNEDERFGCCKAILRYPSCARHLGSFNAENDEEDEPRRMEVKLSADISYTALE